MHLDSDMSYLWVCVLGNDFMNGGGLFEDAPLPVGEVSMPAPVEEQKPEGINSYFMSCFGAWPHPVHFLYDVLADKKLMDVILFSFMHTDTWHFFFTKNKYMPST